MRIVATAALVAAITTGSASATTFTFDIDFDSGPLTGTSVEGSFTLATHPVGSGTVSFAASNGDFTDFGISIDGALFSLSGAFTGPDAEFVDGVLNEFLYFGSVDDFSATLNIAQLSGIPATADFSPVGGTPSSGGFSVQLEDERVIPLPAPVFLLLGGLGLLALPRALARA
ncbi:MAG: hypothetical protein ACFBSD_06335 [Paracoccaceae bacterium]